MKTLNQQAGMMLIEVLVSLLIFSLGILGLVGLQTISSENTANASERSTAASLANNLVSQMWLKHTGDISSASLSSDFTAWKNRVITSLPNASSNVVVDAATNTTTITITWKSPSKKAAEPNNRLVTRVAISQ